MTGLLQVHIGHTQEQGGTLLDHIHARGTLTLTHMHTHVYTYTYTYQNNLHMCTYTQNKCAPTPTYTVHHTYNTGVNKMYIHRRTTDLSILHQLTEEENSLHPLLSNDGPEVVHCRLQG